MISFSVAAAMGEGPTTRTSEQAFVTGVALPINNKWWGVTALASAGLTDGIHAEIAGGYKVREGDDFSFIDGDGDDWDMDGFEYDQWAVMGGLYYTPVDQLTIGLEGEYFTTNVEWSGKEELIGGARGTASILTSSATPSSQPSSASGASKIA
jgi:opacity protein-like surface antigen